MANVVLAMLKPCLQLKFVKTVLQERLFSYNVKAIYY